MMDLLARELTNVVETTAISLRGVDEARVRVKPQPTKWSAQEILGHLIDSAANNHQRFVRAQEVDLLVSPAYEQDHWVRVQDYGAGSWAELVELWRLYNRHLARVIARIPKENLMVECRIGAYEPVTLQYLAEDYLVHLKHHLRQIDALVGVETAGRST